MNRLTRKTTIKNNFKNCYYYENINNSTTVDVYNKLGELEDLMEELNIDSVEELGKYIHDLNSYVGAYANDPPEKTQQIVKDLNTVIDLRKELGCPLEVVFEAIKEGIYCVDYDNQKIRKFIAPLWFNSTSKQFYWYGNNIGYPDLKDYKKTWWLPSDKEWKDEKRKNTKSNRYSE